MACYRKVEIRVVDLEDAIALCIDAGTAHIKPLVAYLSQRARTAAEAQQLRNALDALEDVEAAIRLLGDWHPDHE